MKFQKYGKNRSTNIRKMEDISDMMVKLDVDFKYSEDDPLELYNKTHIPDAIKSFNDFRKDDNDKRVLHKYTKLNELKPNAFLTMDKDELIEYFNYYDADGSGDLDYEEMYNMLTKLGVNDLIINDVVEEIDENKDNHVQLDEFLNYFSKLDFINGNCVLSNYIIQKGYQTNKIEIDKIKKKKQISNKQSEIDKMYEKLTNYNKVYDEKYNDNKTYTKNNNYKFNIEIVENDKPIQDNKKVSSEKNNYYFIRESKNDKVKDHDFLYQIANEQVKYSKTPSLMDSIDMEINKEQEEQRQKKLLLQNNRNIELQAPITVNNSITVNKPIEEPTNQLKPFNSPNKISPAPSPNNKNKLKFNRMKDKKKKVGIFSYMAQNILKKVEENKIQQEDNVDYNF